MFKNNPDKNLLELELLFLNFLILVYSLLKSANITIICRRQAKSCWLAKKPQQLPQALHKSDAI